MFIVNHRTPYTSSRLFFSTQWSEAWNLFKLLPWTTCFVLLFIINLVAQSLYCSPVESREHVYIDLQWEVLLKDVHVQIVWTATPANKQRQTGTLWNLICRSICIVGRNWVKLVWKTRNLLLCLQRCETLLVLGQWKKTCKTTEMILLNYYVQAVKSLFMCVCSTWMCVAYVHTLLLVPVLVQFSLESSQVTCLLMAEGESDFVHPRWLAF